MPVISKGGHLCLLGRLGQTMIFPGTNIYPAEIERVLAEHPAVKEIAALPMKHRLNNDIPICGAELHGGHSVTEESLQEFASKRLSIRGSKAVFLLDFIPRSRLEISHSQGFGRCVFCQVETPTLLEGIALWGELIPLQSIEDIVERALRYCDLAVAMGLGAIRSHGDTCDDQLKGVRALLDVRDKVKDYIDLQLVAFPQDGVLRDPTAMQNTIRALNMGVDVVDGIPHHGRLRLRLRDGSVVFAGHRRHAGRRIHGASCGPSLQPGGHEMVL